MENLYQKYEIISEDKKQPNDGIERKIWKEGLFKKIEQFFDVLDGWQFDSLHSNIRY